MLLFISIALLATGVMALASAVLRLRRDTILTLRHLTEDFGTLDPDGYDEALSQVIQGMPPRVRKFLGY